MVWLRASVDVAWARVEGSDRPLAVDRDRFARRAAAREAGYREAADLEVDADAPADEVAARVAAWAQRGRRGGPVSALAPAQVVWAEVGDARYPVHLGAGILDELGPLWAERAAGPACCWSATATSPAWPGARARRCRTRACG